MNSIEIIAQIFGILGLILSALSFQEKNNKRFFVKQGLSGLMFSVNFILIGAVAATLFNMTNLVRSALLFKNDRKPWRLIVIEVLYTACFGFSLSLIADQAFQVFLTALTYFSLVFITVFMWLGNGAHIRYVQLAVSSPAWIVHNIFNFSLGGLMCEIFAMTSVIISFIRYGKSGFEVLH